MDIEPLATITSPVASWCKMYVDDDEMSEWINKRIARKDPWHVAVATGMYMRLWRPRNYREFLRKLLASEVIVELAGPERWARSLSGAQLRTIVDLAIAEIGRVEMLFDVVRDEEAYTLGGWMSDLTLLLRRREDLAEIRTLLCYARAQNRLDPALDELDDRMCPYVCTLPRGTRIDDERLRRVAAVDPGAWWALV
jgi:hypothetical protein